jgi:uncharacterized membrane protein YphA (DoxX/SURF4 family)
MLWDKEINSYIVPVVIAIFIFIAAIFIEFISRKHNAIKKLKNILRNGAFLSPTILSITTGIILTISGFKHFLLAPGLGLNNSFFHLLLQYSEIIIGIMLILGVFIRLMTLGLIALFICAFFIFPVIEIFDYLVFAGIGIYLFLVHRDALSFSFFFHPVGKKEIFDKYRKYALPILRFSAGIGVAYAAFNHNILNPSGAISFIEEKPILNIMQSIIGIESYSHASFVFQIGVFGMLIGLLLAFGLLERITSILISIALLLSIFIVGPSFLPIALPYFAILYIVMTGNPFENKKSYF